MRAWYDIFGLEMAQTEDEAGIRASEQALRELIEREKRRGIPSECIVLAGFSQGGAVALQTGLRYPEPLAGILALSCYLPLAASLAEEGDSANRNTSILMAHGDYDPVVPVRLGLWSKEKLRDLGYAPEWREYSMAHEVCWEEISDISDWLGQVLTRKAL
jgi:phospholipase/carboxylesterase